MSIGEFNVYKILHLFQLYIPYFPRDVILYIVIHTHTRKHTILLSTTNLWENIHSLSFYSPMISR